MTNFKILKTTIYVVAMLAGLLSANDLFAYSNECVNDDYYGYSSGHYVICYDGNGNEISVKQYENDFPENGGTLKNTALYTYDEQNRQTSGAYYTNGSDPNDGIIPYVAMAYGYKEDGTQITKGLLWSTGAMITFDENGNQIGGRTGTEEERREFLASFMPDRVVTDSNGNVIARFDGANRLRYTQGADGSAYRFDANGNPTGATKRGPFTIPEANALTKDGPVNTLTITW